MARRSKHPARPSRPRALVASAQVMARHPVGLKVSGLEEWENEAWDKYDTIGEFRSAVGWLANALSRINLVAALPPALPGDEPSAIDPLSTAEEDRLAARLVSAIGGGADGQGQILSLLATHLSVPGQAYLLLYEPEAEDGGPLVAEVERPPDETWKWQVYAAGDIRPQGADWEIKDEAGQWVPVPFNSVVVRIWRPHPRNRFEADSSARACLTTLRQITVIDQAITGAATSRLAGAGVFVLPTEAVIVPMALGPAPGAPPTGEEDVLDEDEVDDFVPTFVEMTMLPISDRQSAAAYTPLVVKLPGDLCDKPRHLTFWTEFSEQLMPLRDAAIKRLALGLDMPPEILTGMTDANHWTAWQVEESAVTLHVEPLAEIICHALTEGYLRPALEAAGMDPAGRMIWYDTTDLTTRPDRSDDSVLAYDRYEGSGEAMRREMGLEETDAPTTIELQRRLTIALALANPTAGPAMLAAAGLIPQAVADAVPEAPAAGGSPNIGIPAPAAPPGSPPRPGTPSEEEPEAEPVPEDEAAALRRHAVLLEACDGLAVRALERAGSRLKSAAGRRTTGGAAAVVCDDPATLHVYLGDATAYAPLDRLLEGAWARVPEVAARLDEPPDVLQAVLDGYTRALLSTGHAHDRERLAEALGLTLVP